MALLALGTISAIVVVAMSRATEADRDSAALERLVQNDALTTSGFNRLEAAMLDQNDDLEQQALHAAILPKFQLDGREVELRIEGIGGKIDPLVTAPEIVSDYLSNSGLDAGEQGELEATLERARHLSNPDLVSSSVFAALLGHVPAAYLAEDLTRFADHSGIDPIYASSRVIGALPDLSPADRSAITNAPAERRSQLDVHSRYFVPNGTRFSLFVQIDWGHDQRFESRLPVALSSAGRLIALAGPS